MASSVAVRAVIALSLLAGCVDFAGAQAEYCSEHPGVCPGGSDSGSADGGPTAPRFGGELPRLDGFPQVGQTLVTSTGTWSSELPITYSYDWYRCAPDGGSCTGVLSGDAGYTLGLADLGAVLQSVVEAGNDAGTNRAASPMTAPVRRLAQLDFVTGFEHGVANVPLNSILLTEESNVQVVPGAARSGRYGLRTDGDSWVRSAELPGTTQVSLRFAIRVRETIGPAITHPVLEFMGSDVSPTRLELTGTAGGAITVKLRKSGGGSPNAAVSLTVMQWAIIRCALTPATVRCSVDGSPDITEPATTGYNAVRIGTTSATAPQIDFDDFAGSNLASDHPLGDGEAFGFAPTREGNHVRPAAFTWKADLDAGVPPGGGAVGTAPLLADWPPRLTVDDWVAQTTSDVGASLEYELADLPDRRSPTAVRAAFVTTAGTNGPSRVISLQVGGLSGALVPSVFPARDYIGVQLALDPDGRPWSKPVFDALTLRVGFSPDAGNQPRLEAFMFEAELPR